MMIILLEMSDKCKNDQCPTSQNAKVIIQTTKGRLKSLKKKTGKMAYDELDD
jgi:hypothetical protein